MPIPTTNYGFNKPNVNSADDEDLWGDQTNENWDLLDTTLKDVEDLAAPVTGAETADFAIQLSDKNKLILVDATAAAVAITLLAAATAGDGFRFGVKKIDASANGITEDPNGAETIDGAATFVLARQYDVVWIASNGTNWFIESGIYTATTTASGVVRKATAAEVKAETADRYADAALLKQHPGIAKAWGAFTGIGSAVTESDYNVATITRTGTGLYDVVFTNAMANNDYAVNFGTYRNAGGSETGHIAYASRTVNGFQIRTYGNGTASNTLFDHAFVSFSIFGELA